MSEKQPVHTSTSTVRSLWQEYRIYADRVDLETHLGTLSIPFDEIENVEVRESDLKGLARGELQLKGFRPALRLDWANFVEHVVIDRSSGRIHRILFTPDDPPAFAAALKKAMANA